MKLTRRQEEFVNNLHDLNRELDGPIHYSVLAERLGVSPFTAYDMLCLLEEKGFVTSQYRLASDKSGPGRAERLFYPSPEALAHKRRLFEEAGGQVLDHEGLRQFVFDHIRSGKFPDKDLLQEMLARIPPEEQQGALRYCMEVMTVIALRLQAGRAEELFDRYLLEILPQHAPAKGSNLCLLGGFAFGILAQECASDAQWVRELLEHVSHYLEIVAGMSQEECDRLGNYIRELFALSAGEPAGA